MLHSMSLEGGSHACIWTTQEAQFCLGRNMCPYIHIILSSYKNIIVVVFVVIIISILISIIALQ